MYTDEVRTPQALRTRYIASLNELKCRVTASGRRSSGIGNNNFTVATASVTPSNGAKPNKSRISPQMCTTACTPPPKRLQKCRTQTPQLSSTQFEWDIEEVSQLKPADVEPHETQFHDSPDPDQESKAQLAISAFFKESHILPSPVDCPLRKHRIILNEINDNTPISNKAKVRSRDCEVQTELSLPPVLPKALEDALRPYLQPHLAGAHLNKSISGADVFNNSMRRKLFDLQNIIVLGEMEQQQEHQLVDGDHAQMVGSSPQAKQTMFAGRLSESAGEGSSSFGCLSPIRNLCGLQQGTPDDGNGNSSTRRRKQLLHELVDLPSPIAPSEHLSRRLHRSSNCSEHATLSENTDTGRPAGKFTPDRSSSPMALEYSTDGSINQRVSRLRVNSIRHVPNKPLIEEVRLAMLRQNADVGAVPFVEVDTETEIDFETDDEDEEGMQLSQLSTHSFNCSSNSDTPRGHRRRRSANRKNLSQSFGANLLDDAEHLQQQQLDDEQAEQNIKPHAALEAEAEPSLAAPRVGFYRTDSGFNETGSVSNFACSQELASGTNYECASLDVSMACCSTPSARS